MRPKFGVGPLSLLVFPVFIKFNGTEGLGVLYYDCFSWAFWSVSPYCLYWPLVYVMFVLVHRNMQAIILRTVNITHTLCVSVTLVYFA